MVHTTYPRAVELDEAKAYQVMSAVIRECVSGKCFTSHDFAVDDFSEPLEEVLDIVRASIWGQFWAG